MKFDNLSAALSPHNLADIADITITEGVFSVKMVRLSPASQQYNARVGEFSRNRKKPISEQFAADVFAGKVTPETIEFIANVLIIDWSLIDDEGNNVPFEPSAAIELLSAPGFGQNIANRLLLASRDDAFYKQEWTQEALKN